MDQASGYGLAVSSTDRTNLVSDIMDLVQQPPRETLQSVFAELRSKPRGLIVEAEDLSTETGFVIAEGLRQQIREPSHILFEASAYILMPHPSVVRIRPETMYGDDAGLHVLAF